MEEIVYFELNNWMPGENYPPVEPFIGWVGGDFNHRLRDAKWCRENRICVVAALVDMSQNYTISAPKSWVENSCPELLTTYSGFVKRIAPAGESEDEFDDADNDSRYGPPFLYYCDRNVGLTYAYERDDDYGYTYYELEKEEDI